MQPYINCGEGNDEESKKSAKSTYAHVCSDSDQHRFVYENFEGTSQCLFDELNEFDVLPFHRSVITIIACFFSFPPSFADEKYWPCKEV